MKYHLEMTLQQWFDTLVAKRLEMTAKCVDDSGSCFYLDEKTGNKCLIGYFIPDNHTASSSRGCVKKVMRLFPDLFSCTDRTKEEFTDFLVDVQNSLHDNNDTTKFSDKEYVLDQCTRAVDVLCTVYDLNVPDCFVEYREEENRG